MKLFLTSERGMRIVNAGFFLVAILMVFSQYRGLVLYGAWIVYLRNCTRETTSPVFKNIYKVFLVLAFVLILMNVFVRIKPLLELF